MNTHPPGPAFRSAQPPAVYAVATPEATPAVLRTASSLAAEVGSSLVLVVPQIVDPAESLELRARKRQWWIAACERQAQLVHPVPEIQLCAGNSLAEAIERAVPRSTIVIGGPRGIVWPSPIQRLTERWRRRGYDPVFVSTSPPGRIERFMWRRVLATHGAYLFGDAASPQGRSTR